MTHHRGGIQHHRTRTRSGRDNLFYLYEEPDTGAVAETDFLTVFPGWNVWDVYQVNDLPFSLIMVGVSPERQLRIWVEDAVRLGAPGALVADSVDLKGGQVEILNGLPTGLQVSERKEQVSGPVMLVSGPATLKTVRFFNRGDKATMAWPHDDSYLLDKVYTPSPTNPATSGPGPTTIANTVGSSQSRTYFPTVVYIGGAIAAALYVFRKEIFSKIKERLSGNKRKG